MVFYAGVIICESALPHLLQTIMSAAMKQGDRPEAPTDSDYMSLLRYHITTPPLEARGGGMPRLPGLVVREPGPVQDILWTLPLL